MEYRHGSDRRKVSAKLFHGAVERFEQFELLSYSYRPIFFAPDGSSLDHCLLAKNPGYETESPLGKPAFKSAYRSL